MNIVGTRVPKWQNVSRMQITKDYGGNRKTHFQIYIFAISSFEKIEKITPEV